MKSYPSIPRMTRDNIPNIYMYLFQKYDGTQIRAEWNSKRGFYKFGTRTQLIDEKTMPFGRAINILKLKYEKDISIIFNENKWRDAICFFEFYGPSSFAGAHNFNEPMTVTLLDVNPYKHGILPPEQFIKYFGGLDTPKVLYEGYVSAEIFDEIKRSTLNGMTFEGCVAKGTSDKKIKMPIMFKIKSQAWLDKLKIYCKGDDNLFNKLI